MGGEGLTFWELDHVLILFFKLEVARERLFRHGALILMARWCALLEYYGGLVLNSSNVD